MKRSKIAKVSKTPVAKLKKICMGLVKNIVSIRDGDVCQKCQERVYGSNRHRSHVIPVSAGNKLAFDELNMKILCYHCHMNWWHKNPLEAQVWFKEKFPQRFEYLMENRGIQIMKYTDWIDLEKKLRERLVELE